MAYKEQKKFGQLTHAGVDRLEALLAELGIKTDEQQRLAIRQVVGPRVDREEEAKFAAMWESFKGERPQHKTMQETLESISEQARKINN